MTKTNDKGMEFWDIASIVFVCTAANHLGLVTAVETAIKHKLPVANCIKCLTFWSVFVYGCGNATTYGTIAVLAISFLSAWASIWLDLIMGVIDHIYIKVYEQIYTTADETDADALGAADAVPDVPEERGCGKATAYGTED